MLDKSGSLDYTYLVTAWRIYEQLQLQISGKALGGMLSDDQGGGLLMRMAKWILQTTLLLVVLTAPLWADVNGKVFTSEGLPVPGAEVWLTVRPSLGDRQGLVLGKVITDGQGRFALRGSFSTTGSYYWAIAYEPGHGLGWASIDQTTEWLKIVLPPPGTRRIRVFTSDGQPLADAEVTISSLYGGWDRLWQPYPIRLTLPEALSAKFPRAANEEGWIVLQLCPDGTRPTLCISAPGCARTSLRYEQRTGDSIVLSRAGSMEGRLICPEAPEVVAHRRVELLLWDSPHSIAGSYQATSDVHGRFRRDDLPPGKYSVTVSLRPEDRWQPDKCEDILVEEGKVASAEFTFSRAYRVTGRVVHGGRGVPGVPVDGSLTDSTGKFVTYALPGKHTYTCYRPPSPYVWLDQQRSQKSVEVKAHDNNRVPDLKVGKGVQLPGIVVDPGGKPVPGAVVIHYDYSESSHRSYSRRVVCDQRGKFELPPYKPVQTRWLMAGKGDAVTPEPVTVKIKEGAPRVKLVLKEGAGAYIKGMVESSDGEPTRGAAVEVLERQERWGDARVGMVPTSDDGSFVFGPLLPQGLCVYKLKVSARGHADKQIEEHELKSGETWDVGTITLLKAGSTVTGKLVDLDGNPLSGAMVFSLNAPTRVQTPSITEGEFSLAGLYPTEAYVFAEKSGYYLNGVMVMPGGEPITISLCPEGQTAPWAADLKVMPRRMPEVEEREMAIRLVERAVEALDASQEENRSSYASSLLNSLAKIDPDRALAAAAERDRYCQDEVLGGVAESLFDTDPVAALSILKNAPDNWRWVYRLQEFGKHFANSRPDLAREALEAITEECGSGARKFAVCYLANAAEIYLKIGDREAGEAAIEQAVEFVSKLSTWETDAYQRGAVAAHLALFDVERALELMESIKGDDEYYRQSQNLAACVARTDPQRAVEIWRAATDGRRTSVFPRLAGEAAGQHPDLALKMIADVESESATSISDALAAYVNVALRTVESDPETARVAISHIRELARRPAMARDPYAYSWYRSPQASLVAAAILGAQCGDPDPRSLFLRVLTMESRQDFATLPGYEAEQKARMAQFIALVDPGTARSMISPYLEDPSILGSYGGRYLVAALAVISPAEAEQFIAKIVEATEPEQQPRTEYSCASSLVAHITTPPEKRLGRLLSQMGFWVPEYKSE